MYVIVSSSEVKSNLNDSSIGFGRKSSYAFCVGIKLFLTCFGILQKKWLNIFDICFFSVINFPFLLMFLIAVIKKRIFEAAWSVEIFWVSRAVAS